MRCLKKKMKLPRYKDLVVKNLDSGSIEKQGKLNHILPFLLGFLYIRGLLKAFNKDRKVLVKLVLYPLAVLITSSVLKGLIGRKRPFEKYDELKDHKASSLKGIRYDKERDPGMPSRHTACALAIFLALSAVSIPLSVCSFILAIFTAVIRMATGLHYVTDILAGWALAAFMYLIF